MNMLVSALQLQQRSSMLVDGVYLAVLGVHSAVKPKFFAVRVRRWRIVRQKW